MAFLNQSFFLQKKLKNMHEIFHFQIYLSPLLKGQGSTDFRLMY